MEIIDAYETAGSYRGAALYGTGTSPQPRGIKNATSPSLSTVSMGTNGAALVNFDPHLDAMQLVSAANFEPNAYILAPRTRNEMNKLKNTIGDYIEEPDELDALDCLVTNQVPINLTQGSATTASDVFVGQWDQLLIGMRTELQVLLIDQAFVQNLQIAFMAYLRADVQIAHTGAFSAVIGVL